MKTLIIATLLTASVASAETKVDKPTVCLAYSIAKTGHADDDSVAICYDGKKPALFYRYQVVEMPGKESGRVNVLLGWR